jgi:hypothetical protein
MLKLHDPEQFDAHKARTPQQLLFIAQLGGFKSIEEAEERNWIMSDIDSNVPPPSEEAGPKKRGRPRGPAKPKKSSQAEALQAALDFVSPVENDNYEFGEYVALSGNMAVMCNGVLAAGHPIVEELTLCPQLDRLKAALARTGKTLVITETQAGQLSIKGEKLRALVPCLANGLPPVVPDAPILEGDFDILKEAFRVCGTLASEKGERVIEASLLLEPNTCTGTNGAAMLQFWHGVSSLPPGTVIPKVFAAAIAASKKKITGIGGNWNGQFLDSITFWFDGGCWLKSQCYNDRWPSLAPILDVPSQAGPVPAGLFDAIEAVTHFIDEDKSSAIHFANDAVMSHADINVGAQYEVKGLPGGKKFNGKLVKQVAPWVKTLDLVSYPDKAFFFGGEPANPVRGAIMCMVNM